jgi:putative PIN family toxin of toxin-antitoxin system
LVRALLDANVLISAAIRPSGQPGRIIKALLTPSFDLILSPGIVAEVEIALALPKIRKYLREPEDAPRWLADVVVLADLVQDTGNITGVCRDPADDVVLAAAVEGRADKIVTGDDDLLVLGDFQGIAMVTPRDFLDAITVS